jgi:carbon monoxide dehydrogenase subunit G
MELKGTHLFNAPRDAVWEALLDPQVLAKALPGSDKLDKLNDNEYRAAMNVRVGPVQGRFQGTVELSDIIALTSYHLKVSGEGTPGFLNGAGTLHLEPSGDGTLMRYEGEVQVGGRIASVGQRLLDSTARSMIRQGLKALDEQLVARLHGAPAEPEPAPDATPEPVAVPLPAAQMQPVPSPAPAGGPTAGPSAGKMALEVAKDVARDLASDYIPADKQEKVYYALLGALGMLLFVVLVRLVQRD